jgi:hypothetical protein
MVTNIARTMASMVTGSVNTGTCLRQ